MKKLLVILFVAIASSASMGQSEEAGLFVGGSYYLGDLNTGKQFYRTKLTPGLVYRHNFKDNRWVFRVHAMYGRVEAFDSDSEISWHQQRNLDFRSSIIEFGPSFELNFVEYEMGSKTNFGNRNKKSGTAYIFAGINFFRMKPEGLRSNGNWMELQPLGTEGQTSDEQYKLNQISIPMGIGIKFNLGPRFALSMEYGLRKTFTDYLDDVSTVYMDPDALEAQNGELAAELANKSGDTNIQSGQQRGNPGVKDWYIMTGALLTYRLQRPGTCSRW